MPRLIFASRLDYHAKHHPRLRRVLFALESSLVLLLWWLLQLMSPERAARVGGWIVSRLGPRVEKSVVMRENLCMAFPDLDTAAIDALAQRAWYHLGMVFGEYPHLAEIARANGDARIEIVDRCGLEKYRTRQRQAVFIGAHLSNWEVMALALARDGVPLLALYAPLQNPRLDELMSRARRQLGCTMLARGESMRGLIKQVREGGSIGLLLDLAADDGIAVPFFGRDMVTSLTPARMAERYGCDIVPVRTERLGPARFRFTAYPALDFQATGDDETARAFEITRQLNVLMEQWIREAPEEWLSANRRWSKRLHREYGRS
jgi:Kdo2-lipid IVA lauroyltransferase/acyltransferase